MDKDGFTDISKNPSFSEMDMLTKKYLGKNVIVKYFNAEGAVEQVGLVEFLGDSAITIKTLRGKESYIIPYNYSIGLKIKKIKCFKKI